MVMTLGDNPRKASKSSLVRSGVMGGKSGAAWATVPLLSPASKHHNDKSKKCQARICEVKPETETEVAWALAVSVGAEEMAQSSIPEMCHSLWHKLQ